MRGLILATLLLFGCNTPTSNRCSWSIFTPFAASNEFESNDQCVVTPDPTVVDLTYTRNSHVFTFRLDTANHEVGQYYPATDAVVDFDGCTTWQALLPNGSPGGSIYHMPPRWDVVFQGTCGDYAWFAEFKAE